MSRAFEKLAAAIARKDFVIFDNDGVTYSVTPEMHAQCHHASARAAREILPHLTYAEAHRTAIESCRLHNNSTQLFVARHGADEAALHKAYHRNASLSPCLIAPDEALAKKFDHFHLPYAMLTQADRVWAVTALTQSTLRRHFPDHRIYASEDVHHHKKWESPAPFLQVLISEGFQPHRAIMVEDTIANLVHAKAIGMMTILVCGDNRLHPDQHPHVDFQVKNLSEFLDAAALAAELIASCRLHPRMPQENATKRLILPVPYA